MYNDDVIIPMLLKMGYPKEDANTYCLAGSSQVVFSGKSNMCCDVGMYNALKALEFTLHKGMDAVQSKEVGVLQEEWQEGICLHLFERFLPKDV